MFVDLMEAQHFFHTLNTKSGRFFKGQVIFVAIPVYLEFLHDRIPFKVFFLTSRKWKMREK